VGHAAGWPAIETVSSGLLAFTSRKVSAEPRPLCAPLSQQPCWLARLCAVAASA